MPGMKKPKIIIVDGLNRIGLAIARALAQADDFAITVVAPAMGELDTIRRNLKSRVIDRIHLVDGLYDENNFVPKLGSILKKENADVVFPAQLAAVLWLARSKGEFTDHCRVVVEDYQKVIKFHDKRQTMRMAKQLGIPIPDTVFPDGIGDVKSYAENAVYPVVLKARKGHSATGVWYAGDKDQLLHLYSGLAKKEGSADGFLHDTSRPLLQEFIPGQLHDATALGINGEMKLGLTQQRIITNPSSGGPGIVNVTTFDRELLQYAGKLIGHTKWNGALLFDFIRDQRDGRAKLLEVNPRFWGTTWLSIQAGFNYPYYLVRQALGHPLILPAGYQRGLMARWLTSEFFSIFEKPSTPRRIMLRLKGFVQRFSYKSCVYDVRLADIKPTMAEFIFRLLHIIRKPNE